MYRYIVVMSILGRWIQKWLFKSGYCGYTIPLHNVNIPNQTLTKRPHGT